MATLAQMAGILVDILFVIILFIYILLFNLFIILFIYYLFQSTVVVDYTLTTDNS